jgi:hypothetical protein
MSYRHAENMITRNGGQINDTDVEIKRQEPKTVPLEVAFEGHYPVEEIKPTITKDEISFEFEGIGFAVVGPPNIKDYAEKNHVFQTEMYIDGELIESAKLPTVTNHRRFTPFWRYQLSRGNHKVSIKVLNPVDYAQIEIKYVIVYDNKPVEVKF